MVHGNRRDEVTVVGGTVLVNELAGSPRLQRAGSKATIYDFSVTVSGKCNRGEDASFVGYIT